VKDLPVHLLLFAVVGIVITGMSAIFGEPEDGHALRSLPKRLLWFFLGCAVFAAVLLLVERYLARTS
jgi:type IV secretory pathway VirB2 component (pilin)